MAALAQQALTPDAIYRRAGGRRRYNRQRQADRSFRRLQLIWMMRRDSLRPRHILILPGQQRRWAAELGVSESTISRDVKALNGRAYERWRAAHPIVFVEDEVEEPAEPYTPSDEMLAALAQYDV